MKSYSQVLSAVMMIVVFIVGSIPAYSLTPIDGTHRELKEYNDFMASRAKNDANFDLNMELNRSVQYADENPDKKAPQVGDEEYLFISNLLTKKKDKVLFTLKKIGLHCYIYVDKECAMDDATIDMICENFDEKIYQTDHEYFGSEWDPGIDGDSRITLAYTDIKDGYNPPENTSCIAGYFGPFNQLPKTIVSESNEREMVVLDTYPANPKDVGTLAHEFQHMIHWQNDPKELDWINEGMSCVAEWVNVGVPGQVYSFISEPEVSLCGWRDDDGVSKYGQVFLFGAYVMQQFCRNDHDKFKTFTKNLVQSKDVGAKGLAGALASIDVTKSFEEIFRNFCVANFINNQTCYDGIYSYKGKSFGRYARLGLKNGASPENATGCADLTFTASATVKPWSAKAFILDQDFSKIQGKISVKFEGENQGPVACRNSFDVAAILTDDELSYNTNPTKVQWLNMKSNCSEEVLTTGAGKQGRMILVVCNRGPITDKWDYESDYARYAEDAFFKFSITVSKNSKGDNIVQENQIKSKVSRRTVQAMIKKIAADNGVQSNDTTIAQGIKESDRLNNLKTMEDLIVKSIKSAIGKGQTAILADFTSIYASASETEKRNLDPLRKKIREVVLFEATQNENSKMSVYLKSL